MSGDDPTPLLETPTKKPARWKGILIALCFDLASCLIGAFPIHTIVQAFTYKGAENYAKFWLVLLGPIGLLFQALFGAVAVSAAMKPRDYAWPRWVHVFVSGVAVIAPASVIVTFAILARR